MSDGAFRGGPFKAGRVGLVGWTNVGKSTLLNRLVGERLAAVADVAQTTRRCILGVCHVEGRAQIAFVDTPGLHRPQHEMNRRMVESTQQSLSDVDAVVWVLDAERGIGRGDRQAAALIRRSPAARLAVLNKLDRVAPRTRLLPLMASVSGDEQFDTVVPVSALDGEGVPELIEALIAVLPVSSPLYPDDYLTDQAQRTLVAEWIREGLLASVRQELPHATAVVVERWNEREDGLIEIAARIVVERESQKPIVIGRGGERLKAAGSSARAIIEAQLERRVFLELWVQVRGGWRDDDRALNELELLTPWTVR